MQLIEQHSNHVEAAVDAVYLVGGEFHRSALAIAFITLAGLGVILRIVTRIGRQRSRDIDALLELAVFIATDIAFVGASIDQFSLAHGRTPLGLFCPETRVTSKRCMRIKPLIGDSQCEQRLSAKSLKNDSF
jgi:hypothetical protein